MTEVTKFSKIDPSSNEGMPSFALEIISAVGTTKSDHLVGDDWLVVDSRTAAKTELSVVKGRRSVQRWASPTGEVLQQRLNDQDKELVLTITAPDFDGSANAFVIFKRNANDVEIVKRKVRPRISAWHIIVPDECDSMELGIELAGRINFSGFNVIVRSYGENSTQIPFAVSLKLGADESAVRDIVCHGTQFSVAGENNLDLRYGTDTSIIANKFQFFSTLDLPIAAPCDLMIRSSFSRIGRSKLQCKVVVDEDDGHSSTNEPYNIDVNGITLIRIETAREKIRLSIELAFSGEGIAYLPVISIITFEKDQKILSDLFQLGYDPSTVQDVEDIASRYNRTDVALGIDKLRDLFELRRLPPQLLSLLVRLEAGRNGHRDNVPVAIAFGTDTLIVPPCADLPRGSPDKNRVAYCVHSALPYHVHGYSTRTQGLSQSLLRKGWDIRGFVRLGFPDDINASNPAALLEGVVDGMEYVTSRNHPLHLARGPRTQRIALNATYLQTRLNEFGPAVVHGASNWVTGLSTIMASRALGLPCIYEVRGLWHVTRASSVIDYDQTDEYRESERMEVLCCQLADRVVALTQALKEYLVSFGVNPEKITVVPNGVNLETFSSRPRDEDFLQELGLAGRVVFGFVGSLVHYEGVDLIFEALAAIGERDKIGVLIVGDGAALPELRQRCTQLGLDDCVRFTGRVPFEDVPKYYSIIDIAPFPRRSVLVTELVSPLKPFEAMAMGKVVIASDVAAHKEFIEDGITGRLFRKEDVTDLSRVMQELVEDRDQSVRIAANAMSFVSEERTWSVVTEPLEKIYNELAQAH